MNNTSPKSVDRTQVEYVETHHWRYGETDYVLGYIPSECAECRTNIPEESAGYIRDGPRANDGDGGIDELCFHCGNKVTGFGDR